MNRPETTPGDVAAFLVEDIGFLSSSLGPEDTGVDGTVIWCFAGEFTHHDAHLGPRIQVALGERLTAETLADSVAVTITSPPKMLGRLPAKVAMQVIDFVKRNRDALLLHWQGEIDSGDVIERLARI